MNEIISNFVKNENETNHLNHSKRSGDASAPENTESRTSIITQMEGEEKQNNRINMTTSTPNPPAITTKTGKCSKTENSNINKELQSSSSTSRFADYFVICGLDLDTGLEPDRFAGKLLEICNHLIFF